MTSGDYLSALNMAVITGNIGLDCNARGPQINESCSSKLKVTQGGLVVGDAERATEKIFQTLEELITSDGLNMVAVTGFIMVTAN